MFELSFGDVDFGLKGPLISSEIKQLTCNYIYECLLGGRMNILSTKLNLIDLFLSSWRTITLLKVPRYIIEQKRNLSHLRLTVSWVWITRLEFHEVLFDFVCRHYPKMINFIYCISVKSRVIAGSDKPKMF